MTLHRLGPLAVAPLLLGCASYRVAQPTLPPIQAFGPPPSRAATVCVIRPSHWRLQATYVVRDDGQLVGATQGESYFCYYAEPGAHRITSSVDDGDDELGVATLRAVAGKRYWLQQSDDDDLGSVLQWLDETRAKQLVEWCDYKELVDAPGDDLVPMGVPYARALAMRGFEE